MKQTHINLANSAHNNNKPNQPHKIFLKQSSPFSPENQDFLSNQTLK